MPFLPSVVVVRGNRQQSKRRPPRPALPPDIHPPLPEPASPASHSTLAVLPGHLRSASQLTPSLDPGCSSRRLCQAQVEAEPLLCAARASPMPAKRKASAAATAASPASSTSAAAPPVKKPRVAAKPGPVAAPPAAQMSVSAPPSVPVAPRTRQPRAGPSSRPARQVKATLAPAPELRPKKRKLAPPKPPGAGLPAGAAVTGPTGQIKGRDVVMVSRKAELGSYMRRCKALMVEEGCAPLSSSRRTSRGLRLTVCVTTPSSLRSITLHALSASIPHLFLLLHSLLAILPFPRSTVHHTIKTSSVQLTDELIPDDEEEAITLNERWCSAVEVVISVGGGPGEADVDVTTKTKKTRRGGKKRGKGKGVQAAPMPAVVARTSAAAAAAPASTSFVLEYDEDDEMAAMNG